MRNHFRIDRKPQSNEDDTIPNNGQNYTQFESQYLSILIEVDDENDFDQMEWRTKMPVEIETKNNAPQNVA